MKHDAPVPVGSRWADRDKRETGRVVEVLGVFESLNDGHGGPVYRCATIDGQGRRRRETTIGHHGLETRWKRLAAPSPYTEGREGQ